MEYVVNGSEFSAVLRKMTRMIPAKRPSSLVPTALRLEAEDGRLSVRWSDLQVEVGMSIDAEIETEGTCWLPGRLLLELVRTVVKGKKSEITISSSEPGSVRFNIDRQEINLRTIKIDDFPTLPELGGTTFTVSASLFNDIVKKVVPSSASEDTRPTLTAVLFRIVDGNGVFVAADGFRMCEFDARVESEDVEALIPSDRLVDFSKLMDGTSDVEIMIDLDQGNGWMKFSTPEVTLTSGLIKGKFPNYEQLIPTGVTNRFVANRKDLLACVKVVGSGQESDTIYLKFRTDDDSWVLDMEGGDVVQKDQDSITRGTVDVECDGADEIAFGINSKFLTECVQAIDTEQVELAGNGAGDPILITPPGDDTLKYVVMPVFDTRETSKAAA